jgi:hypothetical protein
MALDASSLLGSPQLAGVKVNPRGAGKSKAANFSGVYAGVVGAGISAAAGMRAEQEQQQTAAGSEMPKFGRLAYLAVTEGEVALIDANAGSLTVRLGEIITRIPRSEVVSAQLDGGGIYSPPLTITFASGNSWQLEVPRPSKKHAKQVVQVLGTAL